jgi:hypothetical protein
MIFGPAWRKRNEEIVDCAAAAAHAKDRDKLGVNQLIDRQVFRGLAKVACRHE